MQALSTVLGRNRDAKDTELGHLGNDRVRNQAVFQVPAMGMGPHPIAGKPTRMGAHQVEGLITQRLVNRCAFCDLPVQRKPHRRTRARGDRRLYGG